MVSEIIVLFLTALYGYVIGSFPTAYLLTLAFTGKDIRYEGDHAVGAKNCYKVILHYRKNVWLARISHFTVMTVDITKGFIVVWSAPILVHSIFHQEVLNLRIVGAIFVILGHNFPIWLGFRGGKGFASLAGIVIYYSFYPIIIYLITFTILYYYTKKMPESTISSAFFAGIITFFIGDKYFWVYNGVAPEIGIIIITVIFIMLLRHFYGKRVHGTEEEYSE